MRRKKLEVHVRIARRVIRLSHQAGLRAYERRTDVAPARSAFPRTKAFWPGSQWLRGAGARRGLRVDSITVAGAAPDSRVV